MEKIFCCNFKNKEKEKKQNGPRVLQWTLKNTVGCGVPEPLMGRARGAMCDGLTRTTPGLV